MSSNPFRRSSIKDASSTSAPIVSGRSEPSGSIAVPLSLDTRAAQNQKHVNFASPPAIPISPASYPSSPESTRQSPAFSTVFPAESAHSDGSSSDPFPEDALGDEHDVAIEQALQNARTNSEITTFKAVQRDAVKDTLSRFGSGARRLPAALQEPAKPQKPALDVDAFKRLLLTGQAGGQLSNNVAPHAQSTSDSSSSADTASLSQRSVLESVQQTREETPRSSVEQERGVEGVPEREEKRKPPPPKPRYGKPIKEGDAQSSWETAKESIPFVSALQAPTPSTEMPNLSDQFAGELDSSEIKKRPPTPPLTRRKSTKQPANRPSLGRSPSSRASIISSSEDTPQSTSAPATPGKMAPPPPPPMRRFNSQSSRKASADLPTTMETSEDEAASLDQFPSLSKRASLNPPPVPPPRRNRGSSRSSVDSHRPSLAQLDIANASRDSGEYRRPSNASSESGSRNENRTVSGASNAADILADLAALQREVDAARGNT